jgi:tRNA(adenine34) deaminase
VCLLNVVKEKEMQKFDSYEKECLRLAKKAFDEGEIPVGAIIIKDKKIIARAYNKKEKNKIATHHAEMLAIAKACKKLKSWRLDECEMIVTLKPCVMCLGAINEARIKKVIYFADDDSKKSHRGVLLLKTSKEELILYSEDMLKKFFKRIRK